MMYEEDASSPGADNEPFDASKYVTPPLNPQHIFDDSDTTHSMSSIDTDSDSTERSYKHSNRGQDSMWKAVEDIFDEFESEQIEHAKQMFIEEYGNVQYEELSEITEEIICNLECLKTEKRAAYQLLAVALGLTDGQFISAREKQEQFIKQNVKLLIDLNAVPCLINAFQQHVTLIITNKTQTDEYACLFANLLYILLCVSLWSNDSESDVIKELQFDLFNESKDSRKHFIQFCIDVLEHSILSEHHKSLIPLKKVVMVLSQALIIVLNLPTSAREQASAGATPKIKDKDLSFFKYQHTGSEEAAYSLARPIVEAASIISSQEPQLLQTEQKRQETIPLPPRFLIENPTNAEYLYRTIYKDLPPLVLCLIRLLVVSSTKERDYKGTIDLSRIKNLSKEYSRLDKSYSSKLDRSRHRHVLMRYVLTIIFTLIKQWRKDGDPIQSMNLCQLLIDGNGLLPLLNIISKDANKLLMTEAVQLHIIDLQEREYTNRVELSWESMYCAITSLRILQKMTKNLFYGIINLINNECHERLYQLLCTINHKECHLLVIYASKILKNLIPFTQQDWRVRHREAIGWVYKYVSLSMCDTWLLPTKRGVNTLAGEAKKQVNDRRTKVGTFNTKNYDQWYEGMNQYLAQMKEKNMMDETSPDFLIYSAKDTIGLDALTHMYNSIQITVDDVRDML